MDELTELKSKVQELEERISFLERAKEAKSHRPLYARQIETIKELVDYHDGAASYDDIKAELNIPNVRLSQLLKDILESPDYKTIQGPNDKRHKYLAKSDFEFEGPACDEYTGGVVYIIRASNGTYKIGISNSPEERLKSLSTASPDDLSVVHVIKSDNIKRAEAALHRRFSHRHVKGEWFALVPDDLRFLRSIKFLSDETLRLLL